MPRSPGLYLHVPFCSAICPYCDFAVTTGSGDRREAFVGALLAEIRRAGQTDAWAPFDTVYLGGGTPSAISDEQLGKILEAARGQLPVPVGGTGPEGRAGATVSIEVNPEDVAAQRLRAWISLGIDRLSLGVQSFDADELRFLGRRHLPIDARRAVETGLEAGLVVSLDLIYGLPGQARSTWLANLETAVALEPHHLSCYQLTIEPGTPFARRSRRGDWNEPSNDAVAELFYLTHEFLASAGYPAYEVSNFARTPEARCGHNRKYWEGVSYLGLGPSAHSFDGRCRWWNLRSERAWRSKIEGGDTAEDGRERLSDRDLALERLMLGLRTPAGVDLADIGVDALAVMAANRARFDRFAEDGLLRVEGTRLVPALDGLARADALAREIEF